MEITEAPAAAPAEPAAAPAAPDFESVIGKFEAAIAPRFDALEQRLPPAADEPTPVTDPNDPDFFSDAELDELGQPTDEAQERAFWAAVRQEAQAIAQQTVSEAVAPITAERREEQLGQQADELEAQYPELGQEKVQERVLELTARWAQSMGLPADQAEQLARTPKFVEVAYLAMKAQEGTAASQTPGATPPVPLEQGGAAGPAEATDAPDVGDRIVQRAQQSRFRLGQ